MKYDAIIIGAGLGGLSAGAFLAKAGKSVLVLERMDAVGGRCRTIDLMGRRFDIGADYFGRKMLGCFAELGKAKEVEPVGFKTVALAEGHRMTIPPGLHTVGELHGMGIPYGDMPRFAHRMGRQVMFNSFRNITSNFEMVNFITDNEHLRDIMNIGAFFTGNEPENMPSYWFNLIFGRTYGYDRPFYPKGGAGSLADILADVIRENGGAVVYRAAPKKIVIEGGRAKGVVLDGRHIDAGAVISAISILQTVHYMVGKEHFPKEYLDTLGYYKEGHSMASMFVVFRREAKIKKGVHVYARFPRNMKAMFRVLGEGRFPDKNMFVLSCPDAINDTGTEHLAGTVKFIVPRGGADKELMLAEAKKVLRDVDELVPDFYANIVDSRLFTPKDYLENFGFASVISPVAESVNYSKMPVTAPVPGLYFVGSTVLPVGGCSYSAMESGRVCAAAILKGTGA